jgi:protein-S-isoprenylcysteine O-methyltransferase Ste14
VPLSDEEARLLQQLEQSLAAEDPDFASTLRGSKQAARNRRIAVLAGLGFVVGLGVMFGGAVTATTWLGVLGFLVMLVGAYFFVTAWRHGLAAAPDAAPSLRKPSSPKSSGSFVDRMEERWQRRQEGDDR